MNSREIFKISEQNDESVLSNNAFTVKKEASKESGLPAHIELEKHDERDKINSGDIGGSG